MIFPESAGENQVTSFDLKYDTDIEIQEIEQLPHQYLYTNDGKICGVIEEEFGDALIYKDRMLLKFYESYLFPKKFTQVVLYKQ